ncbi:MAG TPA: BON domain-containing protein [Rudaea sp.]|nr:BON domain-containing protein [Rudaea sp.]
MKNRLLVTAIGAALAIGSAGIAYAVEAPNSTSATSQDQSAQPGTDTWITTKVKAELMTTKGISSTDIDVTTTNGVVTLSGVLDTKAEVQKSIAVAKSVKGVKKVDAAALKTRG